MAAKLDSLDVDDLVRRYLAGTSEQTLAAELGVSRTPVRRILLEAGVEPRGRSDAMLLRMAQTSPDERQRLAAAAHDAVRGKRRGPDELALRAVARQVTCQYLGRGEDLLRGWLAERGLPTTPQLAAGPYNIDLAAPPVAVELWLSTNHPMRRARLRQKTEDLCDLGWLVVWVWVGNGDMLCESVADKIVTLAESARRDPSLLGQHRVVRGRGDDAPAR